MKFLDLMHILFDMQEKFPDMQWEVDEDWASTPRIVMHLDISDENAKLLNDARAMFSPA